MSATDDVLERNARYAETYAGADLPRPPKLKLAVVGCMDARINYFELLGLEDGDATVITNAGGMVTEEILRSLTLSQRGARTEEIMFIGHTDCGIANEDDTAFKDRVEAETGERPTWSIAPLRDVDDYVRSNVAAILADPFIPCKNVRGFVFDVHTGRLREVELG